MRSLVLLLISGHTVRIALRDTDLPTINDKPAHGADELSHFLSSLPAFVLLPTDCVADGSEPDGPGLVVMAYVEDLTMPQFREDSPMPPNDFQRITAEGPGTVAQYG